MNKHSYITTQINIKPQTKSLINSVPITQYTMPWFQQKIARHVERQEKKYSLNNQSKHRNKT